MITLWLHFSVFTGQGTYSISIKAFISRGFIAVEMLDKPLMAKAFHWISQSIQTEKNMLL